MSDYKATNNMNTYIDTPNANFSDMMNVNIQNANMNTNVTGGVPNTGVNPSTDMNVNTGVNTNGVNTNGVNNMNINANPNTSGVTRTYVSGNNKPKKKTVKISLGSEFRIALLIVVLLLVFVFLLPYLG